MSKISDKRKDALIKNTIDIIVKNHLILMGIDEEEIDKHLKNVHEKYLEKGKNQYIAFTEDLKSLYLDGKKPTNYDEQPDDNDIEEWTKIYEKSAGQYVSNILYDGSYDEFDIPVFKQFEDINTSSADLADFLRFHFSQVFEEGRTSLCDYIDFYNETIDTFGTDLVSMMINKIENGFLNKNITSKDIFLKYCKYVFGKFNLRVKAKTPEDEYNFLKTLFHIILSSSNYFRFVSEYRKEIMPDTFDDSKQWFNEAISFLGNKCDRTDMLYKEYIDKYLNLETLTEDFEKFLSETKNSYYILPGGYDLYRLYKYVHKKGITENCIENIIKDSCGESVSYHDYVVNKKIEDFGAYRGYIDFFRRAFDKNIFVNDMKFYAKKIQEIVKTNEFNMEIFVALLYVHYYTFFYHVDLNISKEAKKQREAYHYFGYLSEAIDGLRVLAGPQTEYVPPYIFETDPLRDYAAGDLFRKVKTANKVKPIVNRNVKSKLLKMTKEMCSKIFLT
ncbi:MAG: hypothetical protein KBB84_08280 [Spirochaetes bacterium]|mgnify:CR=1 FL=1|nr:hypothetical protein [Spirochaetota bacterium]